MNLLNDIRAALHTHADQLRARHLQRFFKTAPGQYGAGDRFIGVRVPQIRAVANQYKHTSFAVLTPLITSPIHEERTLALVILVNAYKKKQGDKCEAIVAFYLQHIEHINNWDLVDISAPHIMGSHFCKKENGALRQALAKSPNMWYRRIAVVSCFYDIRQNDYTAILQLATMLRRDTEDLIHKALGWMLREVGKRHKGLLQDFLNTYAANLPRTMLRYAIEKFAYDERRYYLAKK